MYYNVIIRAAHKPKTTKPTFEMTPGFKPFTRMFKFVSWEELSENLFVGDIILLALKEPV